MESIESIPFGQCESTADPRRVIALSQAVQEILQRIQYLPEEERLLLYAHLAQQAEAEWDLEAADARKKGIDLSVEQVRYAP